MLLTLPIIIPMATGVLALLMRRRMSVQRGLSIAGALALVAASAMLLGRSWAGGVQAAQMGGWPAPFGITLVADPLSAGFVAVAALVTLAVVLFAAAGLDRQRERFGFHPLLHLLLMGVNGAFLTGDLFNMFVWFEVLLIASFVLLILGNEERQLDGAVKYVAINLVSSVFFLAAIGLLYGTTGALNMADLEQAISRAGLNGSVLEAALACLFIVAFGIKAAVFPLYFWLPAAYHTPPAPVAAIFAALLSKVGIYALLRVFTVVFADPAGYVQTALLVIAGGTMLVGAIGALVQRDLMRLLAFLVISAMGFVLMGLAFQTEMGLSGAVFYALQDVLVKGMLFLLAGLVIKATGVRTLDGMGGLYTHQPLLAALFIVPAFSLGGFPPFPGFWGKLILLRAGLEAGYPVLVAVALVASLLTLLVVAQVWARVFWSDVPEERPALARPRAALHVSVVGLGVLLAGLSGYAQPLVGLAQRAAAGLIDAQPYVQAVLGS